MANPDTVTVSADEFARMRKLLDRQEIADCQARIARGADRFDRELYLSACHPGAQVSVGGHTSLAEESFDGGKAMHAAGTIATLHCLSTMNCEIDGDVAHAETYHIYCARTVDETSWAATGRYLDQFERRHGVWGLVFRHISVEWTGKLSPMELALLEAADAPKHRLSAWRDANDVSYLRPLKP
jgi:hypothetical protein